MKTLNIEDDLHYNLKLEAVKKKTDLKVMVTNILQKWLQSQEKGFGG